MTSDPVESTLELSYSSAWLLDAEPEPEAWAGDLPDELDEAGPDWDLLAIPETDHEGEVPTHSWNLGRAAALATAFVPLLLAGEPALASPPLGAPVSQPSPPPETTPLVVWDALTDHRVVLTMTDGLVLRVTVLRLSEGVVVCARELDGLVVLVDPAKVASVRVEELPGAPAPKPQTGQGMIVFGTIATTIGGALGLATLVVGAVCIDAYDGYPCPYATLPLGVASVVNLAVGIPFLVTGLRKRKQYRAKMQEAGAPVVSPFLTPSRGGGLMGGFGVRF
ncbi:hypothetical protein ACNOYE_16600 [Nannocystaceae bacterium ST9]